MGYQTDSNVERVPRNAIGLGNQKDSGRYYLAIANTEFGQIPCKAKDGTAWYSCKGREGVTTTFVWVTLPPSLDYMLKKDASPPNGALKTGQEFDGGDLYAGIAHVYGDAIPGKITGGVCYYALNGREGETRDFSYVVLRKKTC